MNYFQIPEDTELSPELTDLLGRMLEKEPESRIKLQDLKFHPWVTGHGLYPMMKQESNCCLIEVTEDEVENCVKSIPKLDTLILVKVKKIHVIYMYLLQLFPFLFRL